MTLGTTLSETLSFGQTSNSIRVHSNLPCHLCHGQTFLIESCWWMNEKFASVIAVRRGEGERYGKVTRPPRVAIYGRSGGCVEFP